MEKEQFKSMTTVYTCIYLTACEIGSRNSFFFGSGPEIYILVKMRGNGFLGSFNNLKTFNYFFNGD